MGRHRLSLQVCCLAIALAFAVTSKPAAGREWLDRGSVIAFLEKIQIRSLESGLEYCGYFVLRGDQIIATPPTRGRYHECLAAEPRGDVELLASYHSHGTYSVNADSEVPSIDDILGDQEEEVDGYVVTPGGRVWFHDFESGRVVLLCGPECVTTDPDHDDDVFEPIARRYTLKSLRRRFE